jgi:4-alpha-glucanotransferase
MNSTADALRQLAELYGVHTRYRDNYGQEQVSQPEALVKVLQVLGTPLAGPGDVADALRHRRQELWQRRLEPVVVAWDGGAAKVALRLPTRVPDRFAKLTLRLESGDTQSWTADVGELPVADHAIVSGVSYAARALPLPNKLPWGYHQLNVEQGGEAATCHILAAPEKAYVPAGQTQHRTWGVFAPLYALHSRRSWGAGDFGDLEALTDWVRERGGGLVATLPLLAAFLDEPFEPGPYSPASRLFWNEFYLDIRRIPELARCPAARELMNAPAFQAEIEALRAAPLVDYRRQMALKRRVLTELMRTFFRESSDRRTDLDRYRADHPELDDYARFRAVIERLHAPWPAWPDRLRDGEVRTGDYDEENFRYHLYAQWLAREQIQSLTDRARAAGPGPYLDLPLGVNPDSYDVWREREVFVRGMAGGAPPDPFFAKGQNWGFSPQHPHEMRVQGYRYLIACLRHHMGLAGMLRIDHLMGLHRFFWIPHGMEARHGIYVKYPADELYAVFALESHRHKTILVGEDLGTVPPEVPPALARHQISRMYVAQYELRSQPDEALPPVFSHAVASVNTHDMPPFAAFWQGLDVDDRVDLGILDRPMAQEEHRKRQEAIRALVHFLQQRGWLAKHLAPDSTATLRACLEYLSAGPSQVVLANLEDLWSETQPQNVPGTWKERPNWQRRARYALEGLGQVPQATQILAKIDALVKHGSSAP